MKKMVSILISMYFSIAAMDSPSALNEKFINAALRGNVVEANELLEKGANPAYDPTLLCKILKVIFSTPVITAAQKKNKDAIIQFLIYEPHTVLNCHDNNGMTPLMILVRQNEVELVELLLATERVNINDENNQGLTAFDMAKSKEMRDLLKMAEVPAGSGKRKITQKSPAKSPKKQGIVSSRQSPPELTWANPILVPQHKSAQQEFFEAVNRADFKRLRDMVNGGFPSYINDYIPGSNYVTPLMIAVLKNSPEIVRLFLQAPLLDLKKGNISGNTPLILAVINDRLEIVRALLDDGRSVVNQKNKFGFEALDFVDLKSPNGSQIQKLLHETALIQQKK